MKQKIESLIEKYKIISEEYQQKGLILGIIADLEELRDVEKPAPKRLNFWKKWTNSSH